VRTKRVAAAAAAGVVVLLYVGGAYVSGRLSPVARRPLLDGLAPSAPYRWVSPPENLAGANRSPTPATFTLGVGSGGVPGGAFTTPDAQVTVIVPNDSIPAAPGQRQVRLTVTPVDPASLAPPPSGRIVVGNVVHVVATYLPSGDPVRNLSRGAELVLVYPFSLDDGGDHQLIVSPDGSAWRRIHTTDHAVPAQALGTMQTFGYAAVSGLRARRSSSPGPSEGGPGVPLAIVAAGAVLVVVLLVLLLGGRADRRDRRERERRRLGP
jgi:hypothetical protein